MIARLVESLTSIREKSEHVHSLARSVAAHNKILTAGARTAMLHADRVEADARCAYDFIDARGQRAAFLAYKREQLTGQRAV
jgi:hypothetical protein